MSVMKLLREPEAWLNRCIGRMAHTLYGGCDALFMTVLILDQLNRFSPSQLPKKHRTPGLSLAAMLHYRNTFWCLQMD